MRRTLGIVEDLQKQQKRINHVKVKNNMVSLKKSIVRTR